MTTACLRLLAAAVASLLVGCAPKPVGEAPPRAVRAAPVAWRPVASAARYSGTLEPRQQVDLSFRVPGRVVALGQATGPGGTARALQEGDVVKQGDLLASLDLADLRRQVATAEASSAGAAAQARAARNTLAQAEREVARSRSLFKNGGVPQAELDRAESAVAGARAALEAADAQHQARVQQSAVSTAALVDAALRSPLDGVLTRKAVDPGEQVVPNVPVFSVVDLSEFRVVFGVPDTQVARVQPGQVMAVRVEALPDRAWKAQVTRVSPTADPGLRTYSVELALPATPELRAGMTATASWDDAEAAPAAVVPLSAVARAASGDGYVVYLPVAGGRVAPYPVEVADLLENDVVLRSGPDAGVQVITDGAAFLRGGDRVEVVP